MSSLAVRLLRAGAPISRTLWAGDSARLIGVSSSRSIYTSKTTTARQQRRCQYPLSQCPHQQRSMSSHALLEEEREYEPREKESEKASPDEVTEDKSRTTARRGIRRPRRAPLTVTDAAAARIKELMEGKPEMLGVRLGVKKRGCNGYSYTLNYVDKKPPKDEEVAEKGVTIFVDPLAVFFIVGTTMDWEETELSSEFTFKNPNVKGSCGCGESFNV